MKNNEKTEKLIFWGVQKDFGDKVTYVFKKSYDTQDQIVVTFYGRGNCLHPNKGSIMMVSYCLDTNGTYLGTCLQATDQGAYD